MAWNPEFLKTVTPPPKFPTIEQFTKILLNSPVKSATLNDYWSGISDYNKRQYIFWFYSDRSKPLSSVWSNTSTDPVNDQSRIEYFEKFTKESLGFKDGQGGDMSGGSRRRRHRPSSRKSKKSSKRVFRKKSRATRRR
jgi:hypothetical protein